MAKDELFRDSDASPGSFRFDDAVVGVFPDMLRRSVPGYEATIRAIGALAAKHALPGTRCYDLGCSLGAATLAMRHGIRAAGCEIVAVDLAPAMVERCRSLVAADPGSVPVRVEVGDIREADIGNASMVVLNYTLQFLPVADRQALIDRIHAGMVDGGVLVLSEKIAEADAVVDELIVDLHLDFKRQNAYSDLEISRKRTALENVLIPEPAAVHFGRLEAAGFRHSAMWLRHFNFASFLAIR